MGLFPKTEDFFLLFEKQAKELKEASKLVNVIEHNGDIKKHAHKMKQIEHEADDITHLIIKKINSTFITPFDREDIAYLASSMDDVIDELERAINRIYIYDIDPQKKEFCHYYRIINKVIDQVVKGLCELRNKKCQDKLLKHSEIINLLENQADDIHRDTLKSLFIEEKDPIMIIKLREIYESLEAVSDRCEDVANCLETLVIKSL